MQNELKIATLSHYHIATLFLTFLFFHPKKKPHPQGCGYKILNQRVEFFLNRVIDFANNTVFWVDRISNGLSIGSSETVFYRTTCSVFTTDKRMVFSDNFSDEFLKDGLWCFKKDWWISGFKKIIGYVVFGGSGFLSAFEGYCRFDNSKVKNCRH